MFDLEVKANRGGYTVHFVDDFVSIVMKLNENRAFFIFDTAVYKFHEEILGFLPKDQYVLIEALETNKTLKQCEEIIRLLSDRNFRKDNYLVAIGGGIIQDITAFTASILYRGVEWSFIPTTLLAQADSCIGSKTSINLGSRKNLIGNFYPPSEVFIDTVFLNSLPGDDIRSGIGEILHFFLYSNSKLTESMMQNIGTLLRDRRELIPYIQESLKIKKAIIELDEFDKGERIKFNYGHTFGHALESITNFEIKHGLAVTVGMDMANFISTRMNLMDADTFNHVHSILEMNFPQYDWSSINIDNYIAYLQKDKKNIGSSVVCILSEGPGKLFKHRVSVDGNLKNLILDYFQKYLF